MIEGGTGVVVHVREGTVRRRRAVAVGVALAALVLVGGLVARAAWPEPPPPIVSEAKKHPPAPEDPANGARTCAADNLDVRLSADRSVLPRGERVVFTVTMENTGTAPCLVDGAETNRPITVWAGDPETGQRVWSSGDCAEEGRMLLIGPGTQVTEDVPWNGERSVPECGPEGKKIGPGDYSVQVALEDVTGATSQVFRIERPEPPKPSPTSSKDADSKGEGSDGEDSKDGDSEGGDSKGGDSDGGNSKDGDSKDDGSDGEGQGEDGGETKDAMSSADLTPAAGNTKIPSSGSHGAED